MLDHLSRASRWPWRLFHADRPVAASRKLRLFACACCRRDVELRGRPWFGEAVGVAERLADGVATADQLRVANRLFIMRPTGSWSEKDGDAWLAAQEMWSPVKRSHVSGQLIQEGFLEAFWPQECLAVCALLRDIFGNPFRSLPAIDPTWRAWNEGVVTRLAEAAYEERSLPSGLLDDVRLGVLADALEEAGCTDRTILDHLRGPGIHVRGCWLVDLLSGRARDSPQRGPRRPVP
jgi:hypothetical protein